MFLPTARTLLNPWQPKPFCCFKDAAANTDAAINYFNNNKSN
jgi:hypothetical protein